MRILLIESERPLALNMCRLMTRSGWCVTWVLDGEEGYEASLRNECDVIVMDVQLAKRSGWQLVEDLRAARVSTPIMVVSALEDLPLRVNALEIGADDFLSLAFEPAEFVARVTALGRRDKVNKGKAVFLDGAMIDLAEHRLWVDGHQVTLTTREYGVLEELTLREGELVPSRRIERSAWLRDGLPPEPVTAMVRSLNEKLSHGRGHDLIRPVGDGFVLHGGS